MSFTIAKYFIGANRPKYSNNFKNIVQNSSGRFKNKTFKYKNIKYKILFVLYYDFCLMISKISKGICNLSLLFINSSYRQAKFIVVPIILLMCKFVRLLLIYAKTTEIILIKFDILVYAYTW